MVGILVCSRCKAKTKADSIEEGRIRLDHGVGLYIGKPCQDGKAELFFTPSSTEKHSTTSSNETNKTTKKTLKKSNTIDKKPAESN